MDKHRIIIFLFPLLLAGFSAPAFFGYYTFDRIPEEKVSDHITKLIVDLDEANGPYPEEYKQYIISSLKSEKSEVELLEAMLLNLRESYKSLVKNIVIIRCHYDVALELFLTLEHLCQRKNRRFSALLPQKAHRQFFPPIPFHHS